VIQDVAVDRNEGPASSLEGGVDVEDVATIIASDDLSNLLQMLGAVEVLPRRNVIQAAPTAGHVEVSPLAVREHGRSRDVPRRGFGIIGEVNELDLSGGLKGAKRRSPKRSSRNNGIRIELGSEGLCSSNRRGRRRGAIGRGRAQPG
jgi:hypothetical protein